MPRKIEREDSGCLSSNVTGNGGKTTRSKGEEPMVSLLSSPFGWECVKANVGGTGQLEIRAVCTLCDDLSISRFDFGRILASALELRVSNHDIIQPPHRTHTQRDRGVFLRRHQPVWFLFLRPTIVCLVVRHGHAVGGWIGFAVADGIIETAPKNVRCRGSEGSRESRG